MNGGGGAKMAHGSGTAPRRHESGGGGGGGTGGMGRFPDTSEWEAKEALRQRELEEARARAAQMEKTMRWWSDCTANWREKWSKVRNERNKAREEAKLLRAQLDNCTKDANTYKREKQELEVQNEQMRKELEKIHLLLLKHAGQWDHQLLEALENVEADVEKDVQASVESISSGIAEEDKTSAAEKDSGIEEYVLQGAVPKHAVELDADGDADSAQCDDCGSSVSVSISAGMEKERDRPQPHSLTHPHPLLISDVTDVNHLISTPPPDEEMLRQKLSMLQLRLDEATKTLLAEREEKISLHRSLERLEAELNEVRERCEDLKVSKQEAVRDLLQLQDQHQDTVATIRADLMDEANSREGMDRRLADLRAQLERLQAENASEWGKRERLETEKLALERENKKLRGDLRDAQERLERKGRPGVNADTELRQLQQEACDKNKEIGDLKHSHSKLKKALADKTTELAHAVRRAEQYESEVKRLRSRVEELKRELAVAEDEVDTATNNIRKLQRSNDELQEQLESLQVQLEHLHTSDHDAPLSDEDPLLTVSGDN